MNVVTYILFGGLAGVVLWMHGRLKSVEAEVRQVRDDVLREKLRTLRESASFRESPAVDLSNETVAPPVVPHGTPLITPPPLPRPSFPEHGSPPAIEPAHIPAKPAAASSKARQFDWEQFLGVKLFAWICGLALFFAAVFFVKYSFERGLVPPWLRVASGFALGAGLVGAGWRMRSGRYDATAQTLAATGVVILYAVAFACRAFYHFEWAGVPQVFGLMAAITTGAFGLSMRMDSRVVAVLGMLGGFLTPPMLSTGQDNPGGLFSYILLLDAGLLAIVWRKRWTFLAPLAAVGTALMEIGWAMEHFAPEKIGIALMVLPGFTALFVTFWHVRAGQSRTHAGDFLPTASAIGLGLVAVAHVFAFITMKSLADSSIRVFAISFIADALILSMVCRDRILRPVEAIVGTLVFLQLAAWTVISGHSRPGLALGLYVVFGLLHSIFPVVMQRLDPESRPTLWSRLSPAIALLLTLVPLIGGAPTSGTFWPAVILCNGLAILVAFAVGSVLAVVAGFAVTLAVALAWIMHGAAQGPDIAENLFVISGFAVFFFITGLALFRSPKFGNHHSAILGRLGLPEDLRVQVPALAGAMPFLLLGVFAGRARLADPSALFGVALFLAALILGLVIWARTRLLFAVALAGVLSVQALWMLTAPAGSITSITLSWHLGFMLLFVAGPFLRLRKEADSRVPWATSALAALAHWPLILQSAKITNPGLSDGTVTLMFAPLLFAGMEVLRRALPVEHPRRTHHLAWFCGMGLFFVTAALARYFSRQWLSIAWALEGLALVALYFRVPHPGLPRTGMALLLLVFARLALNPAVLDYERSGVRLWNWYLAAYGLPSLSLFAAGHLLARTRDLFRGWNVRAILYTLGTVLLFFLVNVEIADFFGEGSRLRFVGGAGLAQSLAYTIAWALFAFALVAVGLIRGLSAVRWSGLGLLGITLIKLFFDDLSRLDQLYRIGAFASVAVIGIAMSLLYQKLIRRDESPAPDAANPGPPDQVS
jgi:hypothetical protein